MSYYHYWCHSIHSCAATCMVWCFYFWMCVSFWVSSSQFKSNQLPHTLTHNSSRLPSIPPIHFYSFRSKAISHPHTPASLPSPFPDSLPTPASQRLLPALAVLLAHWHRPAGWKSNEQAKQERSPEASSVSLFFWKPPLTFSHPWTILYK